MSDGEWAFVARYRTLLREDVPQRTHGMREVFNRVRYLVRGGIPRRQTPGDLPP